MKLTSMQKMIAAIVVLALVAILAVVFVIMPQFAMLTQLNADEAAAQASVQQANAELAQLESAKARAAQTQAELLKISTELPESPQLPTLIIELQDIANASGVDVTRFGPSQPAPVAGGQYTEVPLSVTASARWDDLLDYLRRINGATRLLRVTSLQIAPPSASGGSTATVTQDNQILGLTLSMKAYVIGNNGVVSSPSTTQTPSVKP
jgi:type IV pilus assembly protein PilO